jgi:hypothetical protein
MLAMVSSLSPPSFAKDNNRLLTNWHLTPDSNRPHPAEKRLAFMVPVQTTITYCGVRYKHGRYRFSGVDPIPLTLKKGGRVTVSLEVLRGEETIKVGKKRIKVRMVEGAREAKLGWADSSGVTEDDGYIQGWPTRMNFESSAVFPLQLQKGDVLLFSQKFKKMAKLEAVEETGSVVKWDSLSASAGCKTCGTTDHPCPEL